MGESLEGSSRGPRLINRPVRASIRPPYARSSSRRRSNFSAPASSRASMPPARRGARRGHRAHRSAEMARSSRPIAGITPTMSRRAGAAASTGSTRSAPTSSTAPKSQSSPGPPGGGFDRYALVSSHLALARSLTMMARDSQLASAGAGCPYRTWFSPGRRKSQDPDR